MTTARNIMTLALESMNRLSPGEALDADIAAVLLRRLNTIADSWSSGRETMFRDVLTTGAVTGTSFTLGAGAFAGVAGEVLLIQSDSLPTDPITINQYNNIILKTQTGRPEVWAFDGLNTVYLYPAALGHTLSVLTRQAFESFADLDTVYAMPAGYEAAFAATLAVAMAPALIGKVTPDLAAAERKAMMSIQNANVRPAMLLADPLRANFRSGSILQGFH